jgi:hypothetical protein
MQDLRPTGDPRPQMKRYRCPKGCEKWSEADRVQCRAHHLWMAPEEAS